MLVEDSPPLHVLIDGGMIPLDLRLDANGYWRTRHNLYLHRVMAELYSGKQLQKSEIVHHINYNKQDNRRCNLMVLANQKDHKILHAITDAKKLGVSILTEWHCKACDQVKSRESFSNNDTYWNKVHNKCKSCVSTYKKEKGLNLDKFNARARLSQQYRRYLKSNKTQISWLNEYR